MTHKNLFKAYRWHHKGNHAVSSLSMLSRRAEVHQYHWFRGRSESINLLQNSDTLQATFVRALIFKVKTRFSCKHALLVMC